MTRIPHAISPPATAARVPALPVSSVIAARTLTYNDVSRGRRNAATDAASSAPPAAVSTAHRRRSARNASQITPAAVRASPASNRLSTSGRATV